MKPYVVFGFGIIEPVNNLHKIRIPQNVKIFVDDEVIELPIHLLSCDRKQALDMVNNLFDKLTENDIRVQS